MKNVVQFVSDHREALIMLGLAFVATMREKLPQPFCRVIAFNWLYGWLHDALKTFVSLRGPSKTGETK